MAPAKSSAPQNARHSRNYQGKIDRRWIITAKSPPSGIDSLCSGDSNLSGGQVSPS